MTTNSQPDALAREAIERLQFAVNCVRRHGASTVTVTCSDLEAAFARTPAPNSAQGSEGEDIEHLDLRLVIAETGSCSCGTKTHEPQYHAPRCLYRVLNEARAEIAKGKALKDKYFWQVRDTCTRAEKAEALATPPTDAAIVEAVQAAIVLIDEVNERKHSRAFYGISQVLHAKLATVRATLARSTTSARGETA